MKGWGENGLHVLYASDLSINCLLLILCFSQTLSFPFDTIRKKLQVSVQLPGFTILTQNMFSFFAYPACPILRCNDVQSCLIIHVFNLDLKDIIL